MKIFLDWLFRNSPQYWEARGDGWFSCEKMVIERIKEYYPKHADQLIEDLLQ